MLTEFSWLEVQPTVLCTPAACSWTCFFALYGPPYDDDRIHPASCVPQSLNGTSSRPTVQSSRGSTGSARNAGVAALKFSLFAFQLLLESASGRPAAST